MAHPPPLLWAQRKDHIILTVNVQDCSNPTVKVEEGPEGKADVFLFSGTKNSEESFETSLKLFDEVEAGKVQTATTARQVLIRLAKKSDKWWPKLVSEKNPKFVSVDWNRWVDSDEEDTADPNPGGFDPSTMDFSQMGGDMEDDSDDNESEGGNPEVKDEEEIPDLEPQEEPEEDAPKDQSQSNGHP